MIPVGDFFIDPCTIFAARWLSNGGLKVFLTERLEINNSLICKPGQEARVVAALAERDLAIPAAAEVELARCAG